jgi:hypothetical protein
MKKRRESRSEREREASRQIVIQRGAAQGGQAICAAGEQRNVSLLF